MATPEELWNEIRLTLGKKNKKPANSDSIKELMRTADGINLLKREIVSKDNVKQLPRLHEYLYVAIKDICSEPSADTATLCDLLSKLGDASVTSFAGLELRLKTLLLRFQCEDKDAIRKIHNELHTTWSGCKEGKNLKSMFMENEAWKSFPSPFRLRVLEAVSAKVPTGTFLGELHNWIGSLKVDIAVAKAKIEPIQEPGIEIAAEEVPPPPGDPVEPQS